MLAEPQLQILVADDLQDGADSMALLVAAWGHRPHVAYDGVTALALARQTAPDVCLLDIAMPRMDGVKLAQALRAEPALAKTTLVAVSGYHEPHVHAAGVFDLYFLKPIAPEPFRRALQLLAASKQLCQQVRQDRERATELTLESARLRKELLTLGEQLQRPR